MKQGSRMGGKRTSKESYSRGGEVEMRQGSKKGRWIRAAGQGRDGDGWSR